MEVKELIEKLKFFVGNQEKPVDYYEAFASQLKFISNDLCELRTIQRIQWKEMQRLNPDIKYKSIDQLEIDIQKQRDDVNWDLEPPEYREESNV
jgi:hypothetical protein